MLTEFSRLMRNRRRERRIKTEEPEIPGNFAESEIFISSDDDVEHDAGVSSEARETLRNIRRDAIALLRQIPAVVSAARELSGAGNLYRVLVSEENVHLLREGSDGIVKPFLRRNGKFVENVNLIRVPPQIAGQIANILTQVALVEVNAKLDVVVKKVDDLAELVRSANRGALTGAIHGLEVAQQLDHSEYRQRQILDACQQILVQLGAVVGQMTAHVNQMPSADIGFWTGWTDRIADAEKAYALARGDFAVVLDGLQRVASAYLEVGQNAAAAKAFSLTCGQFDRVLRRAVDRARLLPYSAGDDGPESAFQDFLLYRPTAEARLHALAEGVRPFLSVILNPSELGV